MLNNVGTPVAIISQLHTLPACTPVNASMAALRLATHDSGPGWIATPFPYDSFIHNSTPVYPGALSNLLEVGLQDILLQHPVRIEKRAVERNRMAHHIEVVVAAVIV